MRQKYNNSDIVRQARLREICETSAMKSAIKSTSLQSWNTLITKYFNRGLRIEARKDRQAIYRQLDKLGLKHEAIIAISGHRSDKAQLEQAVTVLGMPYWLSATPLDGYDSLPRLTLLNITSLQEGLAFIASLTERDHYKVLVMAYATQVTFKGSALVSKGHRGIVDFVVGDHHVDLIAGKLTPHPMLFDHGGIIRFAPDIDEHKQYMVYRAIKHLSGHFEFQYARLKTKKCLSFIDYNDEPSYEDIDSVFDDLVSQGDECLISDQEVLCGLPASSGIARGKCTVVLSKSLVSLKAMPKGNILITDTTTPELTWLMAKAGAIVSDLGGVTSHAAIVCREMGIPCIVGTHRATQLLKNGDEVLVDANSGKVMVIGKYNYGRTHTKH